MTTETKLRDLLDAEAGGGASGAGGWDDVVRRGRHRQRVRRVQSVALVAVLAGLAATALALAADDPTVETVPPATDPGRSLPDDAGTTVPSSTTTVPVPVDGGAHIQAARAQGALLTVLIPWSDPASGYDPCLELQPRVVESEDQIAIELISQQDARGVAFASCQASPFSGRGLIELTDPIGDREVVDLSTGNAVFLVDGASLLFPTVLPEGFDLEVRDEFGSQGSWMLSFLQTPGDAYVNVTTGYGGTGECDREMIEVRGTTGRLCRVDEYGRYDLHWEEGGRTIAIEVGSTDPETDSGLTLDDVLAVAEGLEPLG